MSKISIPVISIVYQKNFHRLSNPGVWSLGLRHVLLTIDLFLRIVCTLLLQSSLPLVATGCRSACLTTITYLEPCLAQWQIARRIVLLAAFR